jgi:hypothetical protein
MRGMGILQIGEGSEKDPSGEGGDPTTGDDGGVGTGSRARAGSLTCAAQCSSGEDVASCQRVWGWRRRASRFFHEEKKKTLLFGNGRATRQEAAAVYKGFFIAIFKRAAQASPRSPPPSLSVVSARTDARF